MREARCEGAVRPRSSGRAADFTGVTAPYEVPAAPEVRVETEREEPAESAALVIEHLERASLLA